MKKKLLSFLLVVAIFCTLIPTAFATSNDAMTAANALYALDLFRGTGNHADGTPNFDLDRAPTRNEAVTMLVRLLGKENEAMNGAWDIPFTDVVDWAKPYVGYAYANGLTTGTSATTFGGSALISASQYITFVLRALGYESGIDFLWDEAWELSDSLGVTDGTYNADMSNFTRGDVAKISYDALSINKKDSTLTIADELGISLDENTSDIANCLNKHYWLGANGNDEALFFEVYYFENSAFSCAYQCFDSNNQPLFIGYQTGTYTVSGTTLRLQTTEEYVLTTSSSKTELDDEVSYSDYEVTVKSETTLLFNDWRYVSDIDSAESSYEQIKNDIYDNYNGQSTVDYTYLAKSDFDSVRRDYSTAVAQCAYVYSFTNANGELCVLTDVRYKIISNYSVFTLHNLTSGAVIKDPVSYYQKQASRAYGMNKVAYTKLANEINGYHTQMLQAMKTVLEGGQNPWDGVYVDAYTLNQ